METTKPFGAEFLEEMLTADSDVFGATSICTNSVTYYNSKPVDGDTTSCTSD
jgi:hypothetical protein